MILWKGDPLYPNPLAPVQSCRKFYVVLGTTWSYNLNTIFPTDLPSIPTSKNTLDISQRYSYQLNVIQKYQMLIQHFKHYFSHSLNINIPNQTQFNLIKFSFNLVSLRHCYLMKAIFVIGPSGSGKSTFSRYLRNMYNGIENKENSANCQERQSQFAKAKNNHLHGSDFSSIDINELITIQDIMEQENLGPNGALMYAMNFLEQNLQWLITEIKQKVKTPSQAYLIFDLPGQIQLYLNSTALKNIIQKLSNQFSKTSSTMLSCCVELFDATFLYQSNQFASLTMMSLATMINMQMPQISIINKIDVMKGRKLPAGMLNQYFEMASMVDLMENVTQCQNQHQSRLLEALAKILDSFGQVSFLPFSSYHERTPQMMGQIIYQLEKIFGTLQPMLLDTGFSKIVAQANSDYSRQRMITALENQLFDDEDDDFEGTMQRIQKQLNEQNLKRKQKQENNRNEKQQIINK